MKTDLVGLLRDVKVETAKVVALKPTRYILAISVPLSQANKQAIAETFGEALAGADMLGQEDLSRHADIEQITTSSGWPAAPSLTGCSTARC